MFYTNICYFLYVTYFVIHLDIQNKKLTRKKIIRIFTQGKKTFLFYPIRELCGQMMTAKLMKGLAR